MAPEPDERPGPDERPSPGGVDDFDAIVSGWRNEGPVPEWPVDDRDALGDLDSPADSPADAPDTRPREPDDSDRSAPDAPVDTVAPITPVRPYAPADPDDDHFVPPEPPPLPRLGPPALVGLTLLVLGIVLLVAPGWLGLPGSYGLPLGLLTVAAALSWLLLRLWPTPPPPGGDDGAVV